MMFFGQLLIARPMTCSVATSNPCIPACVRSVDVHVHCCRNLLYSTRNASLHLWTLFCLNCMLLKNPESGTSIKNAYLSQGDVCRC